MRTTWTRSLLLALPIAVAATTYATVATAQQAAQPRPPGMTLTTTAWPDGGQIPLRYTQATPEPAGQPMGVSPPLAWTYVPEGTVSFVLIFRDPDVAANRGTDDNLHWMLWNIPGSARSLPEAFPAGEMLADGTHQTSVSGPSYRGPGANAAGPVHHYTFELFALDTVIEMHHAATPQETRRAILQAMDGHVLGKAVYVGLFKRPS